MFVNVETAQEAFKPLHFFLEGVGAPDGWPDCQSALETRRRIMSSEMRWCVVSIYLTGAQLHPHSPTGKVYCMIPVFHSLPKRTRTITQQLSSRNRTCARTHACTGLICTCTLALTLFASPTQMLTDS